MQGNMPKKVPGDIKSELENTELFRLNAFSRALKQGNVESKISEMQGNFPELSKTIEYLQANKKEEVLEIVNDVCSQKNIKIGMIGKLKRGNEDLEKINSTDNAVAKQAPQKAIKKNREVKKSTLDDALPFVQAVASSTKGSANPDEMFEEVRKDSASRPFETAIGQLAKIGIKVVKDILTAISRFVKRGAAEATGVAQDGALNPKGQVTNQPPEAKKSVDPNKTKMRKIAAKFNQQRGDQENQPQARSKPKELQKSLTDRMAAKLNPHDNESGTRLTGAKFRREDKGSGSGRSL